MGLDLAGHASWRRWGDLASYPEAVGHDQAFRRVVHVLVVHVQEGHVLEDHGQADPYLATLDLVG